MPSNEFIAGWISGALGIVVGHPIDTVKVRLQTLSRYRGIVDCIVKTYKKETILGFYKGMGFPVGSVAVSNSLMFGSYSNALLYITGTECKDWKNRPQNQHVFVAGCISGWVQVYFTAPVDLIKVRLQNQTQSFKRKAKTDNLQARYHGPFHCAVSILKTEGITGLYRGSTALLFRDVPTCGIYFLTYKVICEWMTSDGKTPDPWTMLFAGGCAGTLGWASANPLDVIKSRLQMDGIQGVQYRGIFDCISKSIKQEGFCVLCKGLTANSLRAFPVNAVTFLSYEKLLETFK
ncbi:solute carrier family 25 member 45 [Hyla sarda]|uniref:solute carrier family 25 member 45 n=1 Tax=Hyla sarda TaxID=327740 RepID=UPI0024C42FAE|nr:solute carrier family 25 member 45 [Hyla sarda]XP_056383058.1 solute carrier family 25 member 45 [Hyla sarda]XP_056383059.1 solute carrier family 25 member 45 [Hyla sarda]